MYVAIFAHNIYLPLCSASQLPQIQITFFRSANPLRKRNAVTMPSIIMINTSNLKYTTTLNYFFFVIKNGKGTTWFFQSCRLLKSSYLKSYLILGILLHKTASMNHSLEHFQYQKLISLQRPYTQELVFTSNGVDFSQHWQTVCKAGVYITFWKYIFLSLYTHTLHKSRALGNKHQKNGGASINIYEVYQFNSNFPTIERGTGLEKYEGSLYWHWALNKSSFLDVMLNLWL